MSNLQWLDRRDWTEVDWHRGLSDGELERRCQELLDRSARFGARQEWEYYNDCRNALFVLRSEQQRRKQS